LEWVILIRSSVVSDVIGLWVFFGMKTALQPNETLIREGAANLKKGIESVGGKLFLTDQRLVFESHALNVQSGTTVISLIDIAAINLCWTKFLNSIPLMPNSLAIKTSDGLEHRLVLFGRSRWKIDIEKHLLR
jgi:hypothetical protein